MKLRWPVDSGHIFETGLNAFAFDKPFPSIDDSRESKEGNFLRTLPEVIRLSAVRLLQIDLDDLVATFQRDSVRPITIFYDSTPEGAGYARRLESDGTLSTINLIKVAVNVLNCQRECASSCVQCLNDYGNQAHWEKFDRHIGLEWMQPFLNPNSRKY